MSEKKRVLIIEDDPIVQQLLATLVESRGDKVAIYGNALNLIPILKSGLNDFKVVFLDMILPDITGWEILQTIRSNPEFHNLPVIVLTGAVLSSDEKKNILNQANAVIEKKNFSLTMFEELLDKWL